LEELYSCQYSPEWPLLLLSLEQLFWLWIPVALSAVFLRSKDNSCCSASLF